MPCRVEAGAVGGGVGVVLGEDVLLDLHHARLAQAGDVSARRAGAVVEIAGLVAVLMTVFAGLIVVMVMPVSVAMAVMTVLVGVVVAMLVGMVMMVVIVAVRAGLALALRRRRLDARFAIAASANRTHQSTSSSLIRNSSPPLTCN